MNLKVEFLFVYINIIKQSSIEYDVGACTPTCSRGQILDMNDYEGYKSDSISFSCLASSIN